MTWFWNIHDKKFEKIPQLKTFRDALIYFKWYSTNSSAQKAIEQGRIEYGEPERIAAGWSKWEKVKSWNQEIPARWPIVIRQKSPHPRSFEICNPVSGMRRLCWNRIWAEKPITWFWWCLSYFVK